MHKDERKDAALEAMNKALFASMKYVEEQRSANDPDRNREYELAELWADAAAKARHASEELAMQLQDKSVFWTKQIKWSREEVLLKRIDFEAIQHEITLLLKGA